MSSINTWGSFWQKITKKKNPFCTQDSLFFASFRLSKPNQGIAFEFEEEKHTFIFFFMFHNTSNYLNLDISAMLAQDYINYSIPSLRLNDSVKKALELMAELKLEQLAVVEENEYKGLLPEDSLSRNDHRRSVRDFPLLHAKVYVSAYQHIYEAIKLLGQEIKLVPVVDELNQFKGVISAKDLINTLGKIYAVQMPGGVIVLSLRQYDYSLGQIGQIVEANNAKILSSFIEADADEPSQLRLTLKVNQSELSYIVASLERYGYNVVGKFQEKEPIHTDQDRLGFLIKYLEL
jgi:acetoin utilization protein AcuB